MEKATSGGEIQIGGSVSGIGNVIGHYSTSNVKIYYGLINIIKSGQDGTRMDYNPRHTAFPQTPFDAHPDASLPELKHLIGHKSQLKRLLELYDCASRNENGAIVFITGQPGYGTKALGRTFVDAAQRGGGISAFTRFWPEDGEKHTRRDPRWRGLFEKYAEIQQYAPEFVHQPENAPLWPLVFQLCEQCSWAAHENLPGNLREIPSYLRKFARPGRPLVILLEDFDYASRSWLDLIAYLAPELANGLPILFIISLHAQKLADEIPIEQLTSHQSLALELARKNQAEQHHLSRVTLQDVADYIDPAHADVAEQLHRLSGGLPILVQDLWNEWVRTERVIQDDDRRWWLAPDSLLRSFGSGRDYVRRILEDLWPFEDEAPWPLDQMFDMLALASREGLVFTPEALALTYDVPLERLTYGLEYLLDAPDDPGLVAEAGAVRLNLPSASWQKAVERFVFSPLLVWHILRSEPVDAERLEQLADSIRKVYWPFPEKCASTLADLYEQAGNAVKAKEYRTLADKTDPLGTLMFHAELLLQSPPSILSLSRLWSLVHDLEKAFISHIHLRWAKEFYKKILEMAQEFRWNEFEAEILYYSGYVAYALGEYPQAREYYQRSMVINQELGSKDGIAVNLSSLGDVALALGEYPQAREYYQRALAMYEELGSKDGIAVNLSSLGDVAHALGEYPQARAYYQRALAMCEELGRKDGIAVNLSRLGDMAYALGEFAAAYEYIQHALAVNEQLGRKDGIAANLSRLGELSHTMDEYVQAKVYYQRALAIEEELEHKAGIAANLSGLGRVASAMSEYAQARDYFQRSMVVNEELGRKDGITANLSYLGDVAQVLGEYAQACEYYQRALAMSEDLGRKDGISVNLSRLGKVVYALGEYTAAREYFQRSLLIEEELGRKDEASASLKRLGEVAHALGEYEQAREYFKRALFMDEELGRKGGIATSLSRLGLETYALGECVQASEYLIRALAMNEDLGSKAGIADNLSGLGDLAHALGEYPQAREYYQRALAMFEKLGQEHQAKVVRERLEQLDQEEI